MKKFCSLLIVIILLFHYNVLAVEFTSDLSAKSLLLMEASTGKILYEKNSHESLPPASVTKVMTMLLICEALERGEITLETQITASEYAKSMGGSTIFLETNEIMTLNDLLKGIAVASANDACVAVAEHMCGSVETFVSLMNKRASELGMKDTNFVNCNGLDVENHHSSAYDIAIMSRELLKHDIIEKYTTIWMDTLRDGKFQLANTNKLIRFYKGANGLKTGSTSGAGCCISAAAKRDGMQLIAVVLGSSNSKERFATASSLLNYGFANYAVTEFGEKNSKVTDVSVKNGKENNVTALSKENANILIEKQNADKVKTHINIEKNLQAPVKKGQIIGELIITSDAQTLAKIPLVSDRSVMRKGASDYFVHLLKGLFKFNT